LINNSTSSSFTRPLLSTRVPSSGEFSKKSSSQRYLTPKNNRGIGSRATVFYNGAIRGEKNDNKEIEK